MLEFLECGADVVFSKPFTQEQANALMAHLKARGAKSDPLVKWKVGKGSSFVHF